MFNYPVQASDYLDMSGFHGRGSVAGIVSDDNKIVVNYEACFTYRQAQKVADYLNRKRPALIPELVERIRAIKAERRMAERRKSDDSTDGDPDAS